MRAPHRNLARGDARPRDTLLALAASGEETLEKKAFRQLSQTRNRLLSHAHMLFSAAIR